MNRITGVLITLNEQAYIKRCLSNIMPHVSEMIVVDGGSTDRTVDLAADMGATVLYKKFEEDFGAQKSFAVSQAMFPWVLLIDTDEICEQGIYDGIPKLISQDKYDIIGFSRKNIYAPGIEIDPKDLEDPTKWHNWPDVQYRLFRNYVRYSGKLHESPVGWKSAAHIEKACIIHHKTWDRQHSEDDLYFKMRPTDYPDRLAREKANENL